MVELCAIAMATGQAGNKLAKNWEFLLAETLATRSQSTSC